VGFLGRGGRGQLEKRGTKTKKPIKTPKPGFVKGDSGAGESPSNLEKREAQKKKETHEIKWRLL